MLKNKLIGILIVATSLLASCEQLDKVNVEYYINKDGSGKVTIEQESKLETEERLHQHQEVNQFLRSKKDVKKYLIQKQISKMMEESAGVTKWADVGYKILESNSDELSEIRFSLKTTAYFDDITALYLKGIPSLNFIKFNDGNVEWGFQTKNMEAQNSKFSKLSQPQSVENTKKLFNIINLTLLQTFETGLELNYTLHLPKKVDESGLFNVVPENNKMLEFNFNQDYMGALSGRLTDVLEEVETDNLVVPQKLLKEAFWGSKEERTITLASGLFSGKTTTYVTQSEINNASNYNPEKIDLPTVKSYRELFVKEKGRMRNDYFRYSTKFSSLLYQNKEVDLYDGIVYVSNYKNNYISFIGEVSSGKLDGAFWGFENGKHQFSTSVIKGNPTFETNLLYQSGKKNIQSNPLQITDKWNAANYIRHHYIDDDDIWFFAQKRGIPIFDVIKVNSDNQQVHIFNELNTPIGAHVIYDMAIDQNHKKWFATDTGLFTYKNDNWTEVDLNSLYEQYNELSFSNKTIERIDINPSDGSAWLLFSGSERGDNHYIQMTSSGEFINHTKFLTENPGYFLTRFIYSREVSFYQNKLCLPIARASYIYEADKQNLVKVELGNYRAADDLVFDKEGSLWALGRRFLIKLNADYEVVKTIEDDKFNNLDNLAPISYDKDDHQLYFGARTKRSRKKNQLNIPSDHYVISYEIESGEEKIYALSSSVGSPNYKITIDQENTVWLSEKGNIFTGSLSKLPEIEPFQLGNHLSLEGDFHIKEGENGSIYVKQAGKNLYNLNTIDGNAEQLAVNTPKDFKEATIIETKGVKWCIPNTKKSNHKADVFKLVNEQWKRVDFPLSFETHIFKQGGSNEDGVFLLFQSLEKSEPYQLISNHSSESWKRLELPFETDLYDYPNLSVGESGVFIASSDHGLYQWQDDNNGWSLLKDEEDIESVNSIFDVGQNELVISSNGRLHIKSSNNNWQEYRFSNTGIDFRKVVDVSRNKEGKLVIATSPTNSKFAEVDLFSANLFVYDKGNFEVLAGPSKYVGGCLYDFQSFAMQNNYMIVGTENQGVLKMKIPQDAEDKKHNQMK